MSAVEAAKSALATSKTETETFKAQLATEKANVATLTASQSDFDAKVTKAASARALEITQAQGIPAVDIPKEAGGTFSIPRKQFEAMSPQKQTEFFKNGGKITA